MNREYKCNSFKFIRFDTLSGFNAFKDGESIGIDEVCKHIDSIEQQLKEAEKVIDDVRDVLDLAYGETEIDFELNVKFDETYYLTGEYLEKYRSEK